MTNPDNAIGTNAAYNGRTSVNAFNDVLATRTRGVVSGWNCRPGSGMTVQLGGNGTTRDVAVAEDNAGNKVTINNISGSPVSVTLSAAPGANSRIDAIVAYVDGSAKGTSDAADNPSCCGIIPVAGTASSSPAVPADSAIRSAITSDGANGTSAYYVILATVRVTTSLTTITQNNITAGAAAKLVGSGVVASENVDFATLKDYSTSEVDTGQKWINGKSIYKKSFSVGSISNESAHGVNHGISNFNELVKVEFRYYSGGSWGYEYRQDSSGFKVAVANVNATGFTVTVANGSISNAVVTLYYTKS